MKNGDKEFIKNALKVFGFDKTNIDTELTQFIDMCEYGVGTKDSPLLLTCNLQSCIALIAYEKNFSFLAHMNVFKGNWDKDFKIEGKDEVIRCTKIDDLYNEILKNKDKINGTINIGLIFGVSPVDKEYVTRKVIEKDLLNLFQELRRNNISAVRLPDINSFSFILDSRTGKIIHDGVENGNKVTNIESTVSNSNKEKTDVKEK